MCIKQVVVESCVTVKAVWAWGLFPLAYILAKQAELSSYPVKPCSCITPRELETALMAKAFYQSVAPVATDGQV